MNSIRDGVSGERNFFLRMIDDITQSANSIDIIAKEGVLNTCTRELRYLINLSIKSCLIVNKTTKQTFEEQNVLMNNNTAANRRLAKKRVQCLIEYSTSYQLLCWLTV